LFFEDPQDNSAQRDRYSYDKMAGSQLTTILRGHENIISDKSIVPKKDSPLESFKITNKTSSLDQRIDTHPSGTTFTYISIDPSKGKKSRLSIVKLLSARRGTKSSTPIPVPALPVFHLRDRSHSIQFSQSVSSDILKKKDKYINLSELVVIFNPTQGFFQDFSKITIEIFDNRLSYGNPVKEVIIPNNISSAVFFSLDYSVHVSDFHKIEMRISNPLSIISDSCVWGSLKSEISLCVSNEAYSHPIIPVEGTLFVTGEMLASHKHNPNSLQLGISDESRKALGRMEKRGELLNLTAPEGKQKVDHFEGSEIGSSIGDELSDDNNLTEAKMNALRNSGKINNDSASFQFPESSKSVMKHKPKVSFDDQIVHSISSPFFPVLEEDLSTSDKAYEDQPFTKFAEFIKENVSSDLITTGFERRFSDIKDINKHYANFPDYIKTKFVHVMINNESGEGNIVDSSEFQDSKPISIETLMSKHFNTFF
jgi:hypothetical protein